MKKPKTRCPYIGLAGKQCVQIAGDGHEEIGHRTDDRGQFKTPASWRRWMEGGQARRSLTRGER